MICKEQNIHSHYASNSNPNIVSVFGVTPWTSSSASLRRRGRLAFSPVRASSRGACSSLRAAIEREENGGQSRVRARKKDDTVVGACVCRRGRVERVAKNVLYMNTDKKAMT